jgi:DNA-binding transcriptional regulator YiaG
MTDKVNRGRQPRGQKVNHAKLTEQDVLEIRAINGMSQQAIADQYGVSQNAIGHIVNRKTWAHI